MNPKKHIYEYIKNQHGENAKFKDPLEAAKWQEVFDGMSSGTARVIIDREAADALPDGYNVDLKNKGRYYVAKIVGHQGRVIQRLLLDKQTGDVKFFA
jgi:hypothetical protein